MVPLPSNPPSSSPPPLPTRSISFLSLLGKQTYKDNNKNKTKQNKQRSQNRIKHTEEKEKKSTRNAHRHRDTCLHTQESHTQNRKP